MSRTLSRPAILGLIACCFVLNGWLYYQSISHTFEHARHSAAGHANPLCTWLCSASQVIGASALVLDTVPRPIAHAELSVPSITLTNLPVQNFSRGPPTITFS